MFEFLTYLGVSAICLAALYLLYKATMSYETLHRLNRVVLLGIVGLAAVLPLCEIKIVKEVDVVSMVADVAEVATVGEIAVAEAFDYVAWLKGLVAVVFLLGVAFMTVRLAVSQFSVWRMVRSGQRRELEAGVSLTVVEKLPTPFSWFSHVVVSEEDTQQNLDLILEHELAHVCLGHSWDVLAVDIALCLWWFNPALWLLRRELQSLHEYQADDAVLCRGVDAKTYQLLLIKRAVGSRLHSVANCLNHSNLKNRITMMCKKTSSRWAAAKLLFALPLVAVSLAATATTVYVPKELNKDNENLAEMQNVAADDENPKSNYLYPMTKSELRGFLLQNLQNKQNLVGLIYTDVKVSPEGEVTTVKVAPAPGEKDGMQPLVNEVKHVLANAKITERKPAKEVAYRFEISFGHIEENGEFVWSKVKASDEAITVLRWVKLTDDGEVLKVAEESKDTRVFKDDKESKLSDKKTEIHPNDTIEMKTASGETMWVRYIGQESSVLVLIDGKEGKMDDIEVDDIDSFTVIKTAEALKPYGEKGKNGVILITTKQAVAAQSADGEPLIKCEKMPTFQSGDLNTFRNWMQSQLQYPKEAKDKGIKGRVIFSFVVEKDGSVTSFNVLNTPDKLLSNEVERVFELTPKWEPGTQNGKAVRVKFTVPITFKLEVDAAATTAQLEIDSKAKAHFDIGLSFIQQADALQEKVELKAYGSNTEFRSLQKEITDKYLDAVPELEKAYELAPNHKPIVETLTLLTFRLRDENGMMAKYEKYKKAFDLMN